MQLSTTGTPKVRHALTLGLLTILAGALALPTVARADSFGFTSAGPSNYALLSGSGGMILNGGSVTGNAGDNGNLNLSGAVSITGLMDYSGSLANSSSYTTPTLVSPSTLTGALSNASSVYGTESGLACTGSLCATTSVNLNSSTLTLTGAAGQNVVDLTSLLLNSSTLTLSASSGSTFIVNVGGGMNLNSSSILLSGGITAGDVLFDLGGGFLSSGTWGLNGIVLAPNSSFTADGSGTVCGEFIGNSIEEGSISINSGCASSSSSVPEPATSGLVGFSLLAGGFLLRKFRASSV